MKATVCLLCVVTYLGCKNSNSVGNETNKRFISSESNVDTLRAVSAPLKIKDFPRQENIDTLEKRMIEANLIDVSLLNPDIKVNLRYASDSNFLNQAIYKSLKRAYLEESAAKKLAIAQILLTTEHPGTHILVWDAARPISCQRIMWNALDMPSIEKGRFVSNPRNHSLHNYGCAVDVTLCDSSGAPKEMGTDFDQFDSIAQPRYEWRMNYTGKLSDEAIRNRKILRKVMIAAGFSTISSEWWHFNSCSREYAKANYAVIE